MSKTIPRSIDLDGEGDAAILVHGLTASLEQVEDLAHQINATMGWRVVAATLPGHGTRVRDLNNVQWRDWLRHLAWQRAGMARRHARIHLVGVSLGALLCIEEARFRLEGLGSMVLVAPPIKLKQWYLRVGSLACTSPLFRLLFRYVPKSLTGQGNSTGYPYYSTRALGELYRLTRHISKQAPTLLPPTLVCHANQDQVVHPASAKMIDECTFAPFKEHVFLQDSCHDVCNGKDKEIFNSEVLRFLRRVDDQKVANALTKTWPPDLLFGV